MRFWRSFGLVLFAMLALLAACGTRPSPRTPPCGEPPALTYSEELARSLDARLSPYLHGQTGDFTLRTTSQELTSWLTYVESQRPEIPLRNATVWFSPGRIHFSGTVSRVTPFALRLKARLRVWLEGQTVQVAVEDACLGRVALPNWLKNFIQRVANETIEDAASVFRCTALEVGQGTLFVAGEIQP